LAFSHLRRRIVPQPAVQLGALWFPAFPWIGDLKLRPAAHLFQHALLCKHPAAAMGGLALLIVLIRAPFNLNTGADEAFYLIVGRQWLHGMPPYAGAFDVKPPLLFLLMAGAEALFGPTLLAAKILANAAAILTGCALYLFGARHLGRLAGALAAIFYTFSALPLGSTFSTAEVFMAPFTAFAMLAGFTALSKPRPMPIAALLLAGLLSGAAACVKQTAVFSAAPLALGLLFAYRGSSRNRALILLAGGFSAIPVAFALYFLAIGHLGDLVNDTVLAALLRAGTAYKSWSGAFGILMGGMVTVLPVIVLGGFLWLERRPLRALPIYPSLQFIAAWAGAALVGLLITREMYIAYSLPILLPVCLAAGAFVEHVLGRIEPMQRRQYYQAGTVAASLIYATFIATPVYFSGRSEVKAAEAAAALIEREGQRPDDRIFVVDRDLLVYVTSGAEPPLAVFHPLHLLCAFPVKETRAAWSESLKSRPAFVVLADPPVALQCEQPGRRQAIRRLLAADYCELGRFDSSATAWPGPFTVFGLKERLSASSAASCPDLYASN
jgi:hypothetical protein